MEKRVLFFLWTKVEYGYYEFYSQPYSMITLSGLLNLYDFAVDPEEKSLALSAATRLLKEILMFVNTQGSQYPSAARSFPRYYVDEQFVAITWFLTGKGRPLTE